MIIGISGAQGQGKSTLIKAAIEQSEPPYVDMQLQTARGVLNDWGYTLDEVNGYMPLKLKYQDELFERHYEAFGYTYYQKDYFLAERSFADIYTYALASVGPFSVHSKWLNEYYEKCRKAQREIFSHVVFLSGRVYSPEYDGVRPINTQFSDMVDFLIRKYTQEFSGNTAVMVDEPSIAGRLEELNKIVKNIEV